MALPQVKQTDLDARLAAMGTLGGGWSRAAREDALTRLKHQGLPHRRDEYWKFTNPADLVSADPAPAPLYPESPEPLFDGIDRLELVFNDGVFDAAASGDLADAGLEISLLSESDTADIHWARDLYGTLEAEAQGPVDRPLAALNTAFATEGVLIHATGKAKRPVALVYRHHSQTSDVVIHHVIKVDAGAEMTLLEEGPAAARLNSVIEVDVADDASFHHVRKQGRTHMRRAATASFARLGTRSTYKSFTLTANGVLTRNEHIITLGGDHSAAHVAGAAIGDGAVDPFHHDDTVFITHDAEHCESRQVFKKVLKNGAVGVFQGKILVKDGAQKTDGYQISQALLLDDDSQFLAKPELEIYADDVACSHGSTTGAIDEEALFYLRSRGIAKDAAQDLLVLAFLADALDEVQDPAIAEALLARLEGWLARHKS